MRIAGMFPLLRPLAALFLVSTCGMHAMTTTPVSSGSSGLIAVLGDSLSVSPSLVDSFPAVLQRRLEAEQSDWSVVNFGRNGDTTAQGLARADQVLARRPDILVLALGANDGLRGIPVEAVENNLDTIITRAVSHGARVLLCGMEAPPIGGWRYSLAFHGIFPGLAKRHDLPLVPFLLTGVFGNPELNREDRVHPNARGAQRIAETIWPFLRAMVLEPTVPRGR
jgi:acyl-CoA thioesterase-1